MARLLTVTDLSVELVTRRGRLPAADKVSLAVDAGETLAIVGESGCGKSLTALALMRLLPEPPARLAGGRVELGGRDLTALPERTMRDVRGREISMIFQDPMTSLNPVVSIGSQLIEAIRQHEPLSTRDAADRALELLRQVGIPDPEGRLDDYPHQLSGGMNQRVMIAMAVACRPQLLIADEPTTALDVTIQAQVLALIKALQAATGMALIIITHDLGVVAETADRVAVMYAGRKVEEGPVDDIFERPLHPYTRGLIGATPSAARTRRDRLVEISGSVPGLDALPVGCAFANRCPIVMERCLGHRPPLVARAGRRVACFATAAEETPDVAFVGA
ncbi:ABC transporter ATP-binding protein [Phreatobacter sp. AB_2022a]|uniref:ABC transporter ATP-binding protein n=1 Tax=Phreatobacter sp. AB_2022a TaxID=3003134 RepID=UPI002286D7A2|nr:ABC transporter ATP-binding protein [Phreatobacter sp. AB_2022a]MCZ0733196.1 ABC transporter ATP-binding protein [Phreatobacter sp. AB_2022a]